MKERVLSQSKLNIISDYLEHKLNEFKRTRSYMETVWEEEKSIINKVCFTFTRY